MTKETLNCDSELQLELMWRWAAWQKASYRNNASFVPLYDLRRLRT